MTKRFIAPTLLLASTLAITTIASAEVTMAKQKENPLNDVPAHQKQAVQWLVDRGAPTWAKTQFGVNEPVTRKDAAALIASGLNLSLKNNPPHDFIDVDSRDDKYVRALKASGYMRGITDTRFGSDRLMTRGELALIISRMYDIEGDPNRVTFTDVGTNTRYSKAVAALQQYNITNGISRTKFGTNATMKRGDLAVFLYRLDRMFKPRQAPKITGVTLVSDKEFHLHFDQLIERIPEREMKINGYRMNERRSSYTESTLSGNRHFRTSVKGKTVIVKAEDDYVFKTGFDREFDIRIEEYAFPSLSTEMWNDELRIENIDLVLREDVSKTTLRATDLAAPILLHGEAEFDDPFVDVTFSEPIELVGRYSTIANSFTIWNSSNNGRATSVERVEDTHDQLTLDFGDPIATNELNMNRIRMQYNARTDGYIRDLAGNRATNNILIGIEKVRRR